MTQALAYDDLPEGSDLRREYDGRGGVTLFAPAGDLSAAVRRSISRAALIQGVSAFGLSVLLGGLFLFVVVGINRIDAPLRVPAILALGLLCGALLLFGWWGEYALRSFDTIDARRESTIVHASNRRVLVETVKRDHHQSLDILTSELLSIEVVHEPTRGTPSVVKRAMPSLKLLLRDGSSLRLLAGHHPVELWWAAMTLSEATGVPAVTAPPASALSRWLGRP